MDGLCECTTELIDMGLDKHTKAWLPLGTKCPRSQLRVAHEMKTRISQGEAGPGRYRGLKVSPHKSTGVWHGSLSWASLEAEMGGRGETTKRRSLSGTQELLCSTQQEPVPTY